VDRVRREADRESDMSGRKIGNLILMTLICVVVFIVFMAIRPAPAELVSPAPTRLLVDVVKLERYCASMLMPPAVAAQSPDAQAIFITGVRRRCAASCCS
jgi:hypothetical protein